MLSEQCVPDPVEDLASRLAPDQVADWIARDLLTRCGGLVSTAHQIATELDADQLQGRTPIPKLLPMATSTAAALTSDWFLELPKPHRRMLLVVLIGPGHELRMYVEAARRLGQPAEILEVTEQTGILRRADDRIVITDEARATAMIVSSPAHEVYLTHELLTDLLWETRRAKAWCHRIRTMNKITAADTDGIRAAAVGLLRKDEFLDAYWLLTRAASICQDEEAHDQLLLWAAETSWQMGFVEHAATILDELWMSDAAHAHIDAEMDVLAGVCEAAGGRAAVGIQLLASRITTPGMIGLRATMAAVHLGWATQPRAQLKSIADHCARHADPDNRPPVTALSAVLDGRTDLDVASRQALIGLGQSARWDELLLPRLWPPFLLAQYLGEEDTDIALLERELAGRKQRGAWMGTAPMLIMLADSRFIRGDWAAARQMVTEFQHELTRFRHPVITAEMWRCCLFMAIRSGDTAAAEDALQHLGNAVSLADGPGLDIAHCLQAAENGDPWSAAHHARRVLAHSPLSAHGLVLTRLYGVDLLEALLQAEEVAAAERWIADLPTWAGPTAPTWARAHSAAARALYAAAVDKDDPDITTELFAQAAQLAEESRRPFDSARLWLRFGQWQRRIRRRRAAAVSLLRAEEIFGSLGAQRWSSIVRDELRAAGHAGGEDPQEPPQTTSEGVLTPQQWRIVRLAARGMTNPQIAAQLSISPRTVGYHLYQVYPKLGIASRRQLADLLRNAPGLSRPQSSDRFEH